ncbi:MAG: sodium:proton antiporter [Lachnospiraceae bacterium]|nr:sodium:proton antiporter [Lachnospiraceae bacterium]
MVIKGCKTVTNIIFTFVFIGVLTGIWREAGTIPVIICYASKLIRPSVFLLMTFLLNSMVSFLTGTGFGTAATMGVICAEMGRTMGVNPMITGGAAMSGIFFGDRCSPVSTSAMLVAAVTDTNLYDNLKNMVKSAAVPFTLSCIIYGVMGFFLSTKGITMDMDAVFAKEFVIRPISLIPAIVILVLSVCKVPVRIAMAASILTGVPICMVVQGDGVMRILHSAVLGFAPVDQEVAKIMSGGGIISMMKVIGIVLISACYTEFFGRTGILVGLQKLIEKVAHKTSAYIAELLTTYLIGAMSCNQSLTIILTNQLCRGFNDDKEQRALDLEDSSVIVPAIIPWSIACSVPLSVMRVPNTTVFVTFYLILILLWRSVRSLYTKKRM